MDPFMAERGAADVDAIQTIRLHDILPFSGSIPPIPPNLPNPLAPIRLCAHTTHATAAPPPPIHHN